MADYERSQEITFEPTDKEKQSPKLVIDRILSLDVKDKDTGEVLLHLDDIDGFLCTGFMSSDQTTALDAKD